MLSRLLLCTALFITTGAHAAKKQSSKDKLVSAERLYDDYKYKEAVAKLEAVLKDTSFKDALSRQKARALLAFSYFFLQKTKEASTELDRLFRENADYAIDRDATHPDLLKFYDERHERYLASIAPAPVPAPEPTPPPKEEPKPASEPVEVIKVAPVAETPVEPKEVVITRPPVQTIGDKHKWVRIFPGGIGHFLNHDYGAGAAFLTLEAACVGANIALAIFREQLRASPGVFKLGTNPEPLKWAMNATAMAAIALAVIEILDAFIWSPDRGRASLERSLTADLGPLGSYRFAFTSAALP